MKFIDTHGQRMPVLGFGTWQLTGQQCIKSIEAALKIGYRHIDTAQIYENETEVGNAISEHGIAREELFVTTKVWTSNYRKERVFSSVAESLDKLQLDYVNLLLMHWPNPEVPLAETLGAMQELIQQGKVKAIGVSNFPVRWMREVLGKCRIPISCNQVEYHALLSQDAVLKFARANDIVVTAYSPLARAKLVNHPILENIGKKYGKTSSQVALRWLIEQDGVAAIPKAAHEKNARANFAIFDFSLDDSDLKEIAALAGNNRTVNPDFAPEWD